MTWREKIEHLYRWRFLPLDNGVIFLDTCQGWFTVFHGVATFSLRTRGDAAAIIKRGAI